MRVAIDARRLQEAPLDGTGRALANVLPHLPAEFEVTLLTDARRQDPGRVPHDTTVVASLRGPGSQRGLAWLQVAAPRWLAAHRPSLFHCPFHGLPFRQPVPMVVTIHDLLPETHPEWFARERGAALRAQARWAARTARRVLVPSGHVRDLLLDRYGHLGLTPGRVAVVPNAVDPVFTVEGSAGDAGAEARRPYVVTIGGTPRRQLAVAVDAWARGGLGAELVVVGPEAPPARADLRWAGAVDDDALADLLRGAAAFLTATADEGFGLPPLEAAACGAPVVCARVGALPEVLGDAPLWADAPEVGPLADALAAILTDERAAGARRAASLAHVASLPGWADIAARTARAYDEALW